MNQKTTKYLLITGVALIWGIIVFRVISGLGQKKDVLIASKHITRVNYNTIKDSFILLANYPDPFLPGNNNGPDELTDDLSYQDPVVLNRPVINPAPTKPPFDISSVRYQGMISNPENKKKVALLSIAGKSYMARENDKIEGITVRKITKDKITVKINGKNEEIDREKN